MIALLVITALSTSGIQAQNLVVNPGFEEYGSATDLNWLFGGDMFESFGVRGWSQSTKGSSDFFFRTPSTGKTNITPYGGEHAPSGGNCFAGFIHWVPGREYREYITGELSQPLEKGRKYKFSVRICTGNMNAYMVNELGVLFTATRFSDTVNGAVQQKPQVWLDATAMQDHPEEWTILENVIVAQGGEKYFTIGNFLRDSLTTVVQRTTSVPRCEYAYYYADDASVELTTEDPVLAGTPTPLAPHIKAGSTFIARGVNFDLDKATLRPESYLQLHQIIAELKRKPALKVEVRGYTDSSGNEAHNLQLSKARAKAVADYLVSAGINKSRVTHGGYGSADPLPVTDAALNRRVEFVFR